MSDPLRKLIVSGQDLDRELLATVLSGLVMIEGGSGEIRLTAKAAKLPKKIQILLWLLGRKAAKAMELIREEGLSSGEMEKMTGMKGGSLRGQLSILKKERLVHSRDGKFTVPGYAVEYVKEVIQGQ